MAVAEVEINQQVTSRRKPLRRSILLALAFRRVHSDGLTLVEMSQQLDVRDGRMLIRRNFSPFPSDATLPVDALDRVVVRMEHEHLLEPRHVGRRGRGHGARCR